MLKHNKNRIIKSTIVLLLGFIMLTGLSLETYAAPKEMPDGNVFDAEFYMANNPDVVAVLGTDEMVLYNHYVSCGSKEGRFPYEFSEQDLKNWETYQKMIALKALYPQGMEWDEENTYILSQDENRDNGYAGWEVRACQAFVYTIQEAVFGSSANVNLYETGLEQWCEKYAAGQLLSSSLEPGWIPLGYVGQNAKINAKFEEYWDKIQVGDGLADGGHMSVVLKKSPNHVIVAEGNFNGAVNWERKVSKELLRKSLQYIETPSW